MEHAAAFFLFLFSCDPFMTVTLTAAWEKGREGKGRREGEGGRQRTRKRGRDKESEGQAGSEKRQK